MHEDLFLSYFQILLQNKLSVSADNIEHLGFFDTRQVNGYNFVLSGNSRRSTDCAIVSANFL